jgi:hypothetical protein
VACHDEQLIARDVQRGDEPVGRRGVSCADCIEAPRLEQFGSAWLRCPGIPPIAPPRPLGAVPARRGRLAFDCSRTYRTPLPGCRQCPPRLTGAAGWTTVVSLASGASLVSRHYTLYSNFMHTSTAETHRRARRARSRQTLSCPEIRWSLVNPGCGAAALRAVVRGYATALSLAHEHLAAPIHWQDSARVLPSDHFFGGRQALRAPRSTAPAPSSLRGQWLLRRYRH